MYKSFRFWAFVLQTAIATILATYFSITFQSNRPVVAFKPIMTNSGTDARLDNPSTKPRRPFAVAFEVMKPDDSTPGGMGAVEEPHQITFSQSEYDAQRRRYVKLVNDIVIPADETTVFTATIVAEKPRWVYGRLVFYCGDPGSPEQIAFLPTWVPVVPQKTRDSAQPDQKPHE